MRPGQTLSQPVPIPEIDPQPHGYLGRGETDAPGPVPKLIAGEPGITDHDQDGKPEPAAGGANEQDDERHDGERVESTEDNFLFHAFY